jgi:hypothetical protein
MNFPHLHLLLNHWPIIGMFIGFGLFVTSFFKNNIDLRRGSYIVFSAIALLTIPAFLSGVGAQAMIKNDPGVSLVLTQRHEGSALLALWFILATGALSLIGLWQSQRSAGPKRWNVIAVLIVATLTLVTVVRTGNTGGDIRHPEIRPSQEATSVAEGRFGSIMHKIEPTPKTFTGMVAYSKWVTAVLMDLHFVGLALLIAMVGLLDIRIMGFAKQIPIGPLHRFMPWAMAGLGINVLTGMLTYMGSPEYYNFDAAFWLKIGMLMLLGINVAAFYLTGIFESVEKLGAGDDAPIAAKLVAFSSLILWAAVIIFGRYIQAYDGTIRFTAN